MDSIAAHSDGCSCTKRTPRSRTYGENLFDFFISQSSQRKEPPQNPGRFTRVFVMVLETIKHCALESCASK